MQLTLLEQTPIDLSAMGVDPFADFAEVAPRVTVGKAKRSLRPTAPQSLWHRIVRDCFEPAFKVTTAKQFAAVVVQVLPGFWKRLVALSDLEKSGATRRSARHSMPESVDAMAHELAKHLGNEWEHALKDSYLLLQKGLKIRSKRLAAGATISADRDQAAAAASQIWLWALGCANALSQKRAAPALPNELLRNLLSHMGRQVFVLMRTEENEAAASTPADVASPRLEQDDEDVELAAEAEAHGAEAQERIDR